MNDPQAFINAILIFASAAGGWVLKIIYNSIKDLQNADIRLSLTVEDIKEHYARRDDVREWHKDIKETLVRIEAKLDQKADK